VAPPASTHPSLLVADSFKAPVTVQVTDACYLVDGVSPSTTQSLSPATTNVTGDFSLTGAVLLSCASFVK